MNRLLKVVCVVAVVWLSQLTLAQAEERKEDHDALRALLTKAAEALNSRNLDSVADSLHPGFTAITVDNQKLVGLDAFKTYFNGLFDGPQAMLTKMEVKPVADELTRFLGENTGVTYGTSEDTFHFKDGETRTMKIRWSAVVAKDADRWKLVSIHFSPNLLDNPMLEAAKDYGKKFSLIAGVGGLIVGAILMLLLRRRPQPA